MRAFRRVFLVAGISAAILMPQQAHGLLHAECGGTYTRSTSCTFTAVGPYVNVSGGTSGNSIVVRISDLTGNVQILRCSGQSSCYAEAWQSTGTDSVGPPSGVGPLLCSVITTGSGSYRCQSNI